MTIAWLRVAILATLAAPALASRLPAQTPGPELRWVATAHQMGPVAYRDPLGALSPDGRWVATVERDRVRVRPVGGGPVRVLGTGERTIRWIAWLPDSRRIAVRERTFDRSRHAWAVLDRVTGERAPLWPDPAAGAPDPEALDQLGWSADGRVAGVEATPEGTRIVELGPDGARVRVAAEGPGLSHPAWHPDGRLACLAADAVGPRIRLPCGEPASDPLEGRPAYGPFAFTPDGRTIVYATPDPDGFLDLWAKPLDVGEPVRLTRFARDAYAPTVDARGRVLFKVQDYRTTLAAAPAAGGPAEPLTTFQSETPTWSPDGERIAFTFGAWRHVTDDVRYPDIAQDLGVVRVSGAPADAPHRVVRRSPSEDQGMGWSPDGRWIAFHTHLDGDDIWLARADGAGEPGRISREGSETGWPRWSPDGRRVVYPSYRRNARGARQAFLFVVGLDPETGKVTEPQTRVDWGAFPWDAIHAEWGADGETLVFEAAEGPGRKGLYTVPRTGGAPERFHRFASDQVHSGIAVSPDGRHAAYVASGPDGFFQIFRVPVRGGAPRQVTFDPAHKTQPAWDPTGERIAFTVWDYTAQFWLIEP